MICSKCGKEFEGRFCPWCGAASEEIEKASAADMIAAEETPKAEAPKEETPKAEAPKEETPKAETEQAATEEKAEGSASAGKIKCPKCGNVFSGKFCPECGYKAAELDKCPVCGAPHKAGDKFCAECGYSYEKKPNAAAATVAGIGTAIKNSCKNALAFCKKHSKKVIAAAVVVALILVIVVPISVVFTSPVQPANVDRIKIGDTQERVLSILGDPYDWKEGDTTFEYYSDNYLKIKKELDKISNMEDMESFGDFADALEKEEELNAKLETLEYKETTISFDEDGLVTKVVYNACVSESEEQAKEIKSKEVLTESIRVYEKSEVVYTIKYTDKSIVKAIAQVTPDELLDEYAFSIYDPFAPENKIELSCKVVENSDVTAISEGNCQYRLDQYGKLTISGTGEVTKEGINRLSESNIKEVIIEEGVTGIGEEAFASCGYMTSVSIPDSVAIIGDGAFYWCSSLTNIAIPNGVTSIGNSAFSRCSSLASITIPNSVTSIGESAFYWCSSLTNIAIPNGVTSIGNSAFSSCSSLASITIPNKVTSIGDSTFYNCESLTKIIIPEGVTSIGDYAFSGCSLLTSIVVPDSVTHIGEKAFSGCSLTNITLPFVGESPNSTENTHFEYIFGSWNNGVPDMLKEVVITGGTSIGERAFYECGYLTSITIPNSVTSIGDSAFYDCDSLTTITIPSSVTSIGSSAFYNCSSLTSITIPNSVTSIGSSAFYNCETLTKIIIPDGVTSIGQQAFRDCSSLTSITIPDSVTSIGDRAFYNCSSLENIVVEQGNAIYHSAGNCLIETKNKTLIVGCKNSVIPNDGSVTSIGDSAFRNCSALTSITIPDSVTSIGNHAFYYCSSLTSITIPDSVTSIGSGAFWNCGSLTSINIPEGVTSIGSSAFSGCSSLTSITIPDSVTSIGNYAFEGCSSLTSIVIPDSVTSIGYEAFYRCKSLTSITIPNSVISIASRAFNGCNSLASITVEQGNPIYHSVENCIIVTKSKTLIAGCKNSVIPNDGSVTNIGSSAFYWCTSLTSITIPNSVTSIGYGAFYWCTSLTSINFQGTIAQWKAIDKESGWNSNTGSFTITCTDGKLDKNGNQI